MVITIELHEYCPNIGLRKPFIRISTPKGEGFFDSKCFGLLFHLCNAFAVGDEDTINLEVILSDVREEHKDWVEIVNGKEVHGLGNYCGEPNGGRMIMPHIDLKSDFGIDPKYIYLKKISCYTKVKKSII